MVDSESVVIDREVAAWVAGEPVVPAAGREREQALRDAGHEALQGTGAVALERELVLASVDDRLDPLADAAERAEARWFVAAVRTQQLAAAGGDELLESSPAKPLSAMTVWPGSSARSSSSAATSRSGALAGASSKAIGIPSGAQSRYRRKPQK